MPSFSSFLFDTFPREVGNPFRVVVGREKELIQFAEENTGEKDVFVTVYNLALEVDKIFFDFDEPFAFEFASKFCKYLYANNIAYVPLITPRKGYHIYPLTIPTFLSGEELDQKKALADAQLWLLEQSGCYFPVVSKVYDLNDDIKPYYKKERGVVDYNHYHLFTTDPIAEAKFMHDQIHAYVRVDESEFKPKHNWYVPACDIRIIGDLRRFGRLPNTKKKIEGEYCYCTYLPQDFFNMEETDVLRMKKAPQDIFPVIGEVKSIKEFIHPLKIEFSSAILNAMEIDHQLPDVEPDIPILKLIQRIINPGVFRSNLSPEPTQEARFQFVCELKELGWDVEKVMNAIRALYNSGSWQDYDEGKCYTQVKQIFNKNYRKMSKKHLLSLGLATSKDYENIKKRTVWNIKE